MYSYLVNVVTLAPLCVTVSLHRERMNNYKENLMRILCILWISYVKIHAKIRTHILTHTDVYPNRFRRVFFLFPPCVQNPLSYRGGNFAGTYMEIFASVILVSYILLYLEYSPAEHVVGYSCSDNMAKCKAASWQNR